MLINPLAYQSNFFMRWNRWLYHSFGRLDSFIGVLAASPVADKLVATHTDTNGKFSGELKVNLDLAV